MVPSRFLRSIHGYVFVLSLLLGLVLAGLVAISARVADDLNSLLYVTMFLIVILSLLGWIFGNLLASAIQNITNDVLRLRETIGTEHPERCDTDRYRYSEVQALCTAINDLAATVVREKKQLTVEVEAQQDELYESRQMLHNFMYYIAHKLRTPLNGIRWSAELLKNEEEGQLSIQQRESLDSLERSAVTVLNLAHDLQDIFTIEMKGQVPLRAASMQFREIVDDIAGRWAVLARQKKLKMKVIHPDTELPLIFADVERVRQIIDDLVDNAVRYTPPGGEIKLMTALLDRQSRALAKQLKAPAGLPPSVIFSVADTGIGIPTEDQGRVFSKFFRARNAKDQWVDGTGIGLTLAKLFVEAHGGSIWFTSREGRGTTFYISLPLQELPRPASHRRGHMTL